MLIANIYLYPKTRTGCLPLILMILYHYMIIVDLLLGLTLLLLYQD